MLDLQFQFFYIAGNSYFELLENYKILLKYKIYNKNLQDVVSHEQ